MILNDGACVWQNHLSWFWTGYSNQKQLTEQQACWTYFLTVIKQSPQKFKAQIQEGRNLWFVMVRLAVMLHKLNIWFKKYASEFKLNKRNGNKLIAMATRADFNPSEIRTDSIRQIERWVALANDPNAIQESIFCVHQMDVRNWHCIWGTLLWL